MKPTSQKHQMLISLIKAYPKGVGTWEFAHPSEGIMNQWDCCSKIRKMGIDVITDETPHTNRYGKPTVKSYYRIAETSYQLAVETELKLRNEAQRIRTTKNSM
jgi:hypothetical protein